MIGQSGHEIRASGLTTAGIRDKNVIGSESLLKEVAWPSVMPHTEAVIDYSCRHAAISAAAECRCTGCNEIDHVAVGTLTHFRRQLSKDASKEYTARAKGTLPDKRRPAQSLGILATVITAKTEMRW